MEDLPPSVRERIEGLEQRRDEVYTDWRNAGAVKRKKPRRDEEHNAQVVFFNRIRASGVNKGGRYARAARRTFAIPNGGGRSKREAGRLKAEGVLTGVSDVFCSLPVWPWSGLYIEMKSATGTASPEQRAWIEESNQLGYLAVVCRGADEATTLWEAYVRGAK